MRRFHLVRDKDVSGMSGVGVVAEGVIFHDGQVVMSWRTEISSMGIYKNIQEVEHIHGHGGKTKVCYYGDFG